MQHRLKDDTIWPFPLSNGIALRKLLLNYNPPPIPYRHLPPQLVEYLLYICSIKNLSPKTFELTLYITVRYMLKSQKIQSLQLVCLVSLMLASKLFDYYFVSVTQIHEVSNHEFTNKDIYEMEAKILLVLDFSLFQDQAKNQKGQSLKNRTHTTLYEMLTVIIEMTSALVHPQKHSFYFQTINNVYFLFFYVLYTKGHRKQMLQRLLDPKYVICIIIKSSLVILTQCQGNFPQVLWIQQLFGLKNIQGTGNFDDQFDDMVSKILELSLGKDFQALFS